jgi:hypothetical protein
MDCGSEEGYEDYFNHKLIICIECKTMYHKTMMTGFNKHFSKCDHDVSHYKVITFAEFVNNNDLDEWIGE